MKTNVLDYIALTLAIIGALNWGLIGAFNYNLVTEIFGDNSAISDIIFILVGLSGLYLLYTLSKLISNNSTYEART